MRIQTGTHGVHFFLGNDIPSGTNDYKRSTREYKGIQKEYKNLRELTCRAVQTGYKRSTNGVLTECKRIQANTNGVQNDYKRHKNLGDTTSLVQQIRTELIRTIPIATNRRHAANLIFFFAKIDRIIEGAYKHGTETITWSLRRGSFQPWPPCFPASVKASASAVEERWLQELRKVARYNTSAGLP